MLGDASTIDLSAAFNKEERVDKDAQDPHMCGKDETDRERVGWGEYMGIGMGAAVC